MTRYQPVFEEFSEDFASDKLLEYAYQKLLAAIKIKDYILVKKLLANRKLHPEKNDNYALKLALQLKAKGIVRLLMDDARVTSVSFPMMDVYRLI